MNTRGFNLALVAFWIAVGTALLTRDIWMSQALLDKVNVSQMPLIVGIAFMLAGWNLMRYWVARSLSGPPQISSSTQELRRKIRAITGEDHKVTDPVFDFEKQPDGDAPK
ncbi:MAG: hypothetical protein EXS09_02710 [Gemmataceae bacterium]|nr:hypothetical protein [Gemmataceae bacterium]